MSSPGLIPEVKIVHGTMIPRTDVYSVGILSVTITKLRTRSVAHVEVVLIY